jgi:SAM-dependent methyltransferase
MYRVLKAGLRKARRKLRPPRPHHLFITNDNGRPLSYPFPPIQEIGASVHAIRTFIDNQLGDTEQRSILAALSDDELSAHVALDHSPIPAPENREFYGGDDHLIYWTMGFGDALLNDHLIRKHLGKSRDEAITTFDFGCSSGRVLRHQNILRKTSRILGSDINPYSIAFVRLYLPPEVIGIHNAVFPPLPIADGSVDVVTANSVFTHIDHFEEAWLMEISRILRRGGLAFLTFHSEQAFECMREPDHFLRRVLLNGHRLDGPGLSVPLVTAIDLDRGMSAERLVFNDLKWPVGNTQVFHHTDYVRRKWSQFLDLEEIIPRAHGPHQNGAIMRKG